MRDLDSVVIGDVNGDGLPDIIFTDRTDSLVGFLKNTGTFTSSGGLTATSFAAVSAVSTGGGPVQLVAGAFNSAPKLYLAIAHNQTGQRGSQGVTVMLGNKDFTFGPIGFFGKVGTEYANKTAASAIVLGDFNKDGKTDFVVADGTANSLQLFTGDGTGKF